MQRLKLSREFISSFLKDAIPEYEGMLTFIEENGGWVSPPQKIAEWLTNLNAHDYVDRASIGVIPAREIMLGKRV